MSKSSAYRFMDVAKTFDGKLPTVGSLGPKALYALAAPSTPYAVRSAAEELVVEGEKVRAEDVKRMKRNCCVFRHARLYALDRSKRRGFSPPQAAVSPYWKTSMAAGMSILSPDQRETGTA